MSVVVGSTSLASAQAPPPPNFGGAPPPPSATPLPKPVRRGHPMRIKIDSQPQQAAIFIDNEAYGIEGYTPSTLKLPKGNYTLILKAPGFKRVERPLAVKKSEGFIFTLEREARPAVLDVRSVASDSASGGQLFVDDAPVGNVPGRIEVAAGHHTVAVKKKEFKDWKDVADVQEGETRTIVIDLIAEAKKGALLVTSDTAGADVYVDGQRVDAAPTLVPNLLEGSHTVEVRKDGIPPWRQVVNVVGNQQVKVEARLQDNVPKAGSVRVITSVPAAEVFVDGESKGPANVEIPNLKAGQHIIEVRAQGFLPQVQEVQVVAGEQRLAKVDLQPAPVQQKVTTLRVVTPVPEADVYIDGASVGRAPIERQEVAPGKHFVVVRKQGFAEWKREVDVQEGGAVTMTADLSASGVLKILSNQPAANVFIDGQMVGKTPLTLDTISAGDHLIEVKAPGFYDAKQPVHIDGGDTKVLSADLSPVPNGPSVVEVERRRLSTASFSAVTLDPTRVTLDLAAGYMPFFQMRLNVGAFRLKNFGLDAGIQVRSNGYFTSGGAQAKAQLFKAGPVAFATDLYIGGGGGPVKRNTFEFEYGLMVSILFGDRVRFTIHPYLQVYTDRNCPTVKQMDDRESEENVTDPTKTSLYKQERDTCKSRDGNNGLPVESAQEATSKYTHGNPRDRQAGARLMLQAVLEVAVHRNVNIFFLLEGDPVGKRYAYSKLFSALLPDEDSQIYGRAGVTFKF